MEGVIWYFVDTPIFLILSLFAVQQSQDSLVEFNDVNFISHNPSKRNIDDQLKIIRDEKHMEYLHNAVSKSLSLENNKINKNSKQFNNFLKRNVDKNEPKETNNHPH